MSLHTLSEVYWHMRSTGVIYVHMAMQTSRIELVNKEEPDLIEKGLPSNYARMENCTVRQTVIVIDTQFRVSKFQYSSSENFST